MNGTFLLWAVGSGGLGKVGGQWVWWGRWGHCPDQNGCLLSIIFSLSLLISKEEK